jgi:hypothetical protein
MSRHAPTAAASGAVPRMGPGLSSHLRQPSKTSISQTTATVSRSSDTSSVHSTIRSDAQPTRHQARPGRRCTVHISESYGAPDVLLNLNSTELSVAPGTLMVMAWTDVDKPSTSHAPPRKHDLPDLAKDPFPGPDPIGESQSKRYFFVAKNMPRDIRRTGNIELIVAKHVAEAFGLRKGALVVLSPVSETDNCEQFFHGDHH